MTVGNGEHSIQRYSAFEHKHLMRVKSNSSHTIRNTFRTQYDISLKKSFFLLKSNLSQGMTSIFIYKSEISCREKLVRHGSLDIPVLWIQKRVISSKFEINFRKMEPLVQHRRLLTLLCMVPFDKDVGYSRKVISVLTSLGFFAVEVFGLIASLTYVLAYQSIDLEKAFFAMFKIFGYFCVGYTTISTYLLRHRVGETLQKLSQIYNACEESCENVWLTEIILNQFPSIIFLI